MNRSSLLTMLGATLVVAGCAGLTQMQDTAAKFDQGVHTASTAEMSLFSQVQAAECARNFYVEGFNFATAIPDATTHRYPVDGSSLDLRSSSCVHTELTDAQLAIREKLMQVITLYADSIQALTNGTSDSNLSADAKTVAANIKTLGTQQKFTSVEAGGVAAVNAAVGTIATMIIDHASYKHVKEAAAAMRDPLARVIEELKQENSADAVGLASKADGLINEVRSGLSAARDQSGPASFLDVVSARVSLAQLVVAPPNLAQLNGTLDAVVKANDALARTTNGGAIPEISDLVSRAQQASTLFNAAK